MAYIIAEPCIDVMDRACVEVCPVDCIYEPDATNLPEEERKNMLYIHPETCIDCNACVEECPVEAIYADVDVPDKWEHYTALNEEMCQQYPVIIEKTDPLPTVRTLEEINAESGA